MRKKRRLKSWVKQLLLVLGIGVVILLFVAIKNYFDTVTKEHIEIVSKECALQGYEIKSYYTKSGDKFYMCDTVAENE